MSMPPNARESLEAALGQRYTLERELGRGGTSTIYLARDLRRGRSVALKALHAELAASVSSARFQREIAILMRLAHPHILPLFEADDADGVPFYVMPYVAGESLRERLAREGHLPVRDALAITHEIAGALDYAHRAGVVHRDVKPENILLEDGRALVADFGIACAIRRAADAALEPVLTQAHLAVGTPAYMSPEQAIADPEVDGRGDIYSLGCVAFEMLAGEPPFRGSSAEVIAQRFAGPPPALAARRAGLPRAVDRVVAKALAVAPCRRFTTAAAFAIALSSAVAIEPGVPSCRGLLRASGVARCAVARRALRRAAWCWHEVAGSRRECTWPDWTRWMFTRQHMAESSQPPRGAMRDPAP